MRQLLCDPAPCVFRLIAQIGDPGHQGGTPHPPLEDPQFDLRQRLQKGKRVFQAHSPQVTKRLLVEGIFELVPKRQGERRNVK